MKIYLLVIILQVKLPPLSETQDVSYVYFDNEETDYRMTVKILIM